MADVLLRRGERPAHGGYPGEVVTRDLAKFMALLTTVEGVLSLLPPEEQAEYKRCQQSVIDARRYAERHAHEHWIG